MSGDYIRIGLKRSLTGEFVINELIEAQSRGEKIYIVLPGGGAKGRWQIAVLAYLEQIGFLSGVNGIVGTSVGGLNALLCAKYKYNFNGAIRMWERVQSNKDIYEGQLKGLPGILLQLMFNGGKSVLKPNGLYKIIEAEFAKYKLSDFLPLDIVMTAADLTTGEDDIYDNECNISCDNLAKRTSAIPGLLPAVIGGNRGNVHVDGGYGNNNPVLTAIERGATKVLIIGTAPETIYKGASGDKLTEIAPYLVQYALNKFERDMWARVKEIKHVDIFKIMPVEDTGDILNFGNVEQLQRGYDFAVNNVRVKDLRAWLKL